MATKADFNAEEWSLVLEGPALAGVLVITAERGGMLRESMSLGKVYGEARREQGTGGLVDEIIAEQPQLDPQRFGSAQELRAQGPARVREAAELVESKGTPEEAQAYREFILRLAETVARSHKEGSFLGIGGKDVSENEQAMIDELRSTLDGSA